MRNVFGLTAAVLALFASHIIVSLMLIGFVILGELFERRLYFGAVAALRMPGMIPTRPTK